MLRAAARGSCDLLHTATSLPCWHGDAPLSRGAKPAHYPDGSPEDGGARRGRRESRDLPPRSVVPARRRHHDRRPVRRARPDRCRRGRADRGGAAGHFRRLERAREPSGARARDRRHPPRRSGRHARPQLRRLGRAGARRGQARRDRRGAELAARRARAGALHPPGRAARHAGRRGLRRGARRPGRGGPAHDHARRRLRGAPGARRYAASRRRSPSRRTLS